MLSLKITVNNSYSRIEGLPSGHFNKLRKALSYSKDDFYSRSPYPQVKYMIDKKGEFPTGLLKRVLSFLRDENLKPYIAYLRKRPALQPPNKLKGTLIPYPDQLKAVDIACKHGNGTLSLPTGSGKSLIIALIAARLNVKTLIVTPSLEIKNQLKAGLSELLNDTSKIRVENIDSSFLKRATGYDCLIIDEAHHVAAKTYQTLNKTAWKDIFYRFFLTATPYRNRTDETLLFEGIAGELRFQLSYKDAVSKGYIVPVEAYYMDLPKVPTEAYTWVQVYSELVVNNETRNQMISICLDNLASANVSTLCLVKEIKHGESLSGITGLPFVNGQDEESRPYIKEFNSGKIRALIGTSGVLGEGVDTKACEYVIIAGLGKAKSAFMQQVGRAVRKYPGKETAKIILIRDPSHKFTLRHFNAQKKILLDEFGVKPIKLDL